MNKITKLAVSVALVSLASGALACDYPNRATVPDGATASKDEMIAGQRGVKDYMAAMETYLSCIEAQEAAAVLELGDLDESAKRQRADMFNKKYNAAVEEMNLVAEEFNLQVRAYRERKNEVAAFETTKSPSYDGLFFAPRLLDFAYSSFSISRPRSNLFSVTMRSRTAIRSSSWSSLAMASSLSTSLSCLAVRAL